MKLTFLKHFLTNRSGATAIEYALIASFIVISVVAGITALGNATNANFQEVKTKWDEAAS